MAINTLLSKASYTSATQPRPCLVRFPYKGPSRFFLKTTLCKAYPALPRISIKTESSDYAMLQICTIHISAAFFSEKLNRHANVKLGIVIIEIHFWIGILVINRGQCVTCPGVSKIANGALTFNFWYTVWLQIFKMFRL